VCVARMAGSSLATCKVTSFLSVCCGTLVFLAAMMFFMYPSSTVNSSKHLNKARLGKISEILEEVNTASVGRLNEIELKAREALQYFNVKGGGHGIERGGTRGGRKRQPLSLTTYAFPYSEDADRVVKLLVDQDMAGVQASKFSVDSQHSAIDPGVKTIASLLSHSTSSAIMEVVPSAGVVPWLGEVSILAAMYGHPGFVFNVWDDEARGILKKSLKLNKLDPDSLVVYPTQDAHGKGQDSAFQEKIAGREARINEFERNRMKQFATINQLLGDIEAALAESSQNNAYGASGKHPADPYDPEYVAPQISELDDVFMLHIELCSSEFPTASDFMVMKNAFRSLYFRGSLPFVLVSICRPKSLRAWKGSEEATIAHDELGDMLDMFSRSNYTAHSLVGLEYLSDYALVTFVEQLFEDSPVSSGMRKGNGELGTDALLFVHGSARHNFMRWLNPPPFRVRRKKKVLAHVKSIFEDPSKSSQHDKV
jgi:hypothetical protein